MCSSDLLVNREHVLGDSATWGGGFQGWGIYFKERGFGGSGLLGHFGVGDGAFSPRNTDFGSSGLLGAFWAWDGDFRGIVPYSKR